MMQRNERGFSLLELMVALFVVVIVTSLVSLNISTDGSDIRLQAQVRSLASVSSYALDEAQLQGVDYGLLLQQFDADGERLYGFSWRQRGPSGWRVPTNDAEIFAVQRLPAGVELLLQLEDQPVAELTTDDEQDAIPQVLLYSSGEVTGGTIELRQVDTGDLLWRLEWDLLGRFTLLPRGESAGDERFD